MTNDASRARAVSRTNTTVASMHADLDVVEALGDAGVRHLDDAFLLVKSLVMEGRGVGEAVDHIKSRRPWMFADPSPEAASSDCCRRPDIPGDEHEVV